MNRRFIVNPEGEVKEQKLKEGEPTRKFVVGENGETKEDTFTDEDHELFRLAESLDYQKFFQENPDFRKDFIKWHKQDKK